MMSHNPSEHKRCLHAYIINTHRTCFTTHDLVQAKCSGRPFHCPICRDGPPWKAHPMNDVMCCRSCHDAPSTGPIFTQSRPRQRNQQVWLTARSFIDCFSYRKPPSFTALASWTARALPRSKCLGCCSCCTLERCSCPELQWKSWRKKWKRPYGQAASALPRLKALKAPSHSGYLAKASPVNGASLAAASHHQGPKKPLEFAATETIISAEMPRM